MKEEFVSYETAKKLKEKGFKEKCMAHYYPSGSELVFNQTSFRGAIIEDCLYSYNSLPIECIGSELIDAPTISQVLKWLREEKCLHIEIQYIFSEETIWEFEVALIGSYERWWNESEPLDSYEQAAIAGIEYVLNNLI